MGTLMAANAIGLSAGAALASRPLSTQTLMLGLALTLLGLALGWRGWSGTARRPSLLH